MSGMIKIFNNAALAQFRNVCEHKVRILKRLLKMGITGKPGPQVEGVRMDIFLTILEQAVHALNSTPYLKQGNYGVLTSGHFINPWMTSKVSIRELPEHNMKELRQLRSILVNQMTVINRQLTDNYVLRWSVGNRVS